MTLGGVMGWKITPRMLAFTSLLSGLAAAACASIGPPALSSDLAGTRWAVQSIDGRDTQSRDASIVFAAEDRISGATGCNRFTGVYEAANGAIDVRAIGRTEMACDASLMRQEEAFIAVLDNAERYARQGQRLVITAGGGGSIVLTQLSG